MGTAVQGVGNGGRGGPYLGKNLCNDDPGGPSIWLGYVGDDTAHWEGVGWIPPQGRSQAGGTATSEGGWKVGVSSAGGSDGRGTVTGGEDIRLPRPEHSRAVHFDQAHYGPVSGGGEISRATGGQAVVLDGGLRGRMGGEGGGDGSVRDR